MPASKVDWDGLSAVLDEWFRHKAEVAEGGALIAARLKELQDGGMSWDDATRTVIEEMAP